MLFKVKTRKKINEMLRKNFVFALLAVCIAAGPAFAEENPAKAGEAAPPEAAAGVDWGTTGTTPPVEMKAEELPKGVKKFSYAEGKFTMDAENIPVKDAMRLLSEASGVEIEVHEGVEGKATVNFIDKQLDEAVEKTVESADENNWAVSTRQEHDLPPRITKITVLKKTGEGKNDGHIVKNNEELRFMSTDGREIRKEKKALIKERFTGADAEKFYKTHFSEHPDFGQNENGKYLDVGKVNGKAFLLSENGKYALVGSWDKYFIQETEEFYWDENPIYDYQNYSLFRSSGEIIWSVEMPNSEYNYQYDRSAIMNNGSLVLTADVPATGYKIVAVDRNGKFGEQTAIEVVNSVVLNKTGTMICIEGAKEYLDGHSIEDWLNIRVLYRANDNGQLSKIFEYQTLTKDGPPIVSWDGDIINLFWPGTNKELRISAAE